MDSIGVQLEAFRARALHGRTRILAFLLAWIGFAPVRLRGHPAGLARHAILHQRVTFPAIAPERVSFRDAQLGARVADSAHVFQSCNYIFLHI